MPAAGDRRRAGRLGPRRPAHLHARLRREPRRPRAGRARLRARLGARAPVHARQRPRRRPRSASSPRTCTAPRSAVYAAAARWDAGDWGARRGAVADGRAPGQARGARGDRRGRSRSAARARRSASYPLEAWFRDARTLTLHVRDDVQIARARPRPAGGRLDLEGGARHLGAARPQRVAAAAAPRSRTATPLGVGLRHLARRCASWPRTRQLAPPASERQPPTSTTTSRPSTDTGTVSAVYGPRHHARPRRGCVAELGRVHDLDLVRAHPLARRGRTTRRPCAGRTPSACQGQRMISPGRCSGSRRAVRRQRAELHALAQRAALVRAAVADREVLAADVEDADRAARRPRRCGATPGGSSSTVPTTTLVTAPASAARRQAVQRGRVVVAGSCAAGRPAAAPAAPCRARRSPSAGSRSRT